MEITAGRRIICQKTNEKKYASEYLKKEKSLKLSHINRNMLLKVAVRKYRQPH